MQQVMESCPGKTVMSGVMGFALGGAFGLFMASMSYDTPLSGNPTATAIQSLPLREQLKKGTSSPPVRASGPPFPFPNPFPLKQVQPNALIQQDSKTSEPAPSPPQKTSAKSAPSSAAQNAASKDSAPKTIWRMVLWLVV
jgi:hypothetical protein